jgi:hypothetical protein
MFLKLKLIFIVFFEKIDYFKANKADFNQFKLSIIKLQ